MVPPASRQIPRVLRYSGTSLPCLSFVYGAVTLFGGAFQRASTRRSRCMLLARNPEEHAPRFGLFPVRSPLLRKSMFLSFPPPTKMFQFRGLASLRMLDLQSNRLSHSDILGSSLVCKSPRLFAAYHVLRRLQEPRHPPYALSYFLTPICRLLSAYSFISYPQSCQRTLSLPTVVWRIRESNP